MNPSMAKDADRGGSVTHATIEEEGLEWLSEVGLSAQSVVPMAGDVSSRRYFRVAEREAILAHYPPDLLRSYECFQRTDELLLRAGVPTPSILRSDVDRRWMLTEDVGVRQLSDETDEGVIEFAFGRAMELAQRISRLDANSVANLSPALETELLTREIRRTCHLLFRPELGEAQSATLEQELFGVCKTLGEGPLVPAHRDYMARNLMLTEGPRRLNLVVLDHQDLRLAPWGYDLASLLFDSCPLSFEQSSALADSSLRTEAARLAVARCAVQRCIKIVGTFVGFAQRGQERYLGMVPQALRRAASEFRLLPEAVEDVALLLEYLAEVLERRWGSGSSPQRLTNDGRVTSD